MIQKMKPIIVLLIGLLFSFALMGMSPNSDLAGGETGNAVRPTPLPTAVSSDPGGLIVLQADSTQLTQGMWTRIEWQDPNTLLWHEVEGWQGEFDGDNRVTWYVAPENFNETPFRWRVYSDQSQSTLIVTSEPFDLPNGRWQDVVVNVEW
ncbi:MAG: hypothetical protein GY805_17950 [Chloroflexi bacterium]|nr:hypothetical protein [Chloroflexota bacterium]